jgi:hypothetical protein
MPQANRVIGPQPEWQPAPIDNLLGQAANAAGRMAADHADWKARAEYAARIEREAQAEPEPSRQLEIPYEAEIEI